ncbi:MAG: hypothetical protein AB7O73_08620 [Bacteroidia bacterium]
MNKVLNYIFCITILISCKKDKLPLGGLSGSNYTSVTFFCDTLPEEPPIGWIDTSTNNNPKIQFWAYNPSNSSEIVILDYGGNLYTYNLMTKDKIVLDNGIMFIPSINSSNWVTYGKLDFTIHKIKTNGDSLKQLVSSIGGKQPKWDYTGNYIYYYQPGAGSIPSSVMKIDKEGTKVDSVLSNGSYQCFAKTSDNYVTVIGSGLYLINPVTSEQTYLTQSISFHDFMCFDKDDKNIVWRNPFGVIKLDLATKKIDTLLSFCENYTASWLNISPNSDKLTMGYLQSKQVGSWYKLSKDLDPIEYDLKTKVWRKLIVKP